MSTPFYAVIGHPIDHSLSPRIHRAFARELGLGLDYRALDVGAEAFPDALARFAAEGGRGLSVTLPLKEAAFVTCAERSDRALAAHSCNTLTRSNGQWIGDNTDGSGLIRDLSERQRIDLRGRRCLLLGAGGAARGVAPSLLDAGVERLVVVNRSADKADRLVDALGDPARAVSRYWDDLRTLGEFELIVNATASGHSGSTPELPFSLAAPRFAAVDLNYGDAAVGFLAWARAAKADATIDGLGMLVEQAAEQFQLWHGKRPEVEAVYAALRANSLALHGGD